MVVFSKQGQNNDVQNEKGEPKGSQIMIIQYNDAKEYSPKSINVRVVALNYVHTT